MKTRISALMDGELEDHEISETLRALKRSPELRNEWCDCQLIGAALRGERGLDIDVAARVMSAIDLESTVLAPQPRRVIAWQRPALALAASAAGIAVVAWLVLAPGGTEMPTGSAGLAGAKQGAVVASVVANSQSTPRLQEYLVAHQAYAPGGAMVGGARNIRTVAASGEGR
ncbi:MAG: sigma-E factor negative regulatory protein [Sulfuritalea sp.]|jgi:sigma-E factor negative regulatory protein RseA|nr:sigma-E factor negative regulatory protein [Sulfuritalea sp.]